MLIETEELKILFANAILVKDFTKIEELLHDNGNFNIRDKTNQTVESSKTNFLNWFNPILRDSTIESIQYDQCLFCSTGSPVLLINDGKIPINTSTLYEKEKFGLMFEVQDGKIIKIQFCHIFLHAENLSKFDSNIRKILCLEKNGVSKRDAYLQILGYEPTQEDF